MTDLIDRLQRWSTLLRRDDGPGIINELANVLDEARAALASTDSKPPEPVAWRDPTNTEPGQSVTFDRKRAEKWPHIFKEPLYALASTDSKPTRALVNQQAEDEGLWFVARTAAEGYLQSALRELHQAVEDEQAAAGDAAREALTDTARLEWVMHRMPGSALRNVGILTSEGGLADHREAIDRAIAAMAPPESGA